MKKCLKQPLFGLVASIFLTPVVAQTPLETPACIVSRDESAARCDTVSGQEFPGRSGGGVRYTLADCMTYAVEHSPVVRQQGYANANYRQDYIEAVAALVPSVDGVVDVSASFGRSIDPATNTYTDVSNLGNSYGVSGSMPVFAGLSGINTVRMARAMREMGLDELQRVRDETALRVMQAYYDVVYYTESVCLARQQLATSRENLTRTRKLCDLGLKSPADLAEIEAQAASDDYRVTEQENALALAEIVLREAMNFPSAEPLPIETAVEMECPQLSASLDEVLATALAENPRIRASAGEVRRYELGYSVARGRLYPSILLGGGYSTNYFASLDNASLAPSFGRQFRNNRGYYVMASLRIPIFGGLARRTGVNRARHNLHIAEQRHLETQRAFESEVTRAYRQMQGFGKEFVQAGRKCEAAQLAYDVIENKYRRGLVSPLDLRTAADRLLEARAQRLRARLQYVVQCRIVAYYNGRPLIR